MLSMSRSPEAVGIGDDMHDPVKEQIAVIDAVGKSTIQTKQRARAHFVGQSSL